MKSSDEIKKGLECCAASYADCHKECTYKPDCDGSQILKDALALIQHKERENETLTDDLIAERQINKEQLERIQQLEAERDAAVAGLKSNCTCPECKYFSDEIQDPCRGCKPNDSKFEWRGVQKEDDDD